MSNFIANARIAVYADTTPFSAALKKVVTQAEKTPIKVKLVPDPVGFIADARKQIKSIEGKLPPVKVRVIPDTRGFASAVRLATANAVKNIQVPVGVVAGPVAGGRAAATAAAKTPGVAAGGVVDKRLAAAQLAVNAAVDAGVASRRRLTHELSASGEKLTELERLSTLLTRQELHLAAADDAVKKAVVSGNAALLSRAEAERRVAAAAVARTRPRQAAAAEAAARAADPSIAAKEAEAAAAVQVAADEKAAAAAAKKAREVRAAGLIEIEAQKENERRTVAATEARIAAIQKELVAIDERSRKVQASAAISERVGRKATLLGFGGTGIPQQTRVTGELIGEDAIKRNLAFEDSADAAARSATQFAAARRHAAVAAVAEGDVEKRLAALRAAERAQTAALVEAQIALNEAMAAGVPSLIATREAELALARARSIDAAAAAEQGAAQLATLGRFAASKRALQATATQLTGLRGPALSAQGAFLATAAAAIALTKAIKSAADFESQLNTFRVTAGATAEEMQRVSAAAIDLGRDVTLPGVTAQSAADALTQLSKAGLSVQDSIDGARGVLELATAASIDNSQATELAASALNAFGLAGDQAVRVADVLANAANDSQGSIVDMGVALQQASAVARQAGLSLEQTVAVLTLFARAGLRGSDAGTSFRTALIRLINPTTKAQKEIDKLGLHLRTATGAINLDVFDEFAQKTRNLTAAQRDQALAIIFGQDAIRGAAILARTGTAGFDAQIASLEKTGTAADLAAARMSGLTGAAANLQNQISNAGLAIGQALTPALTNIANVTADAIGTTTDLIKEITDLRNEAKKPIDFIVNIIPNFGGGGGGGGGGFQERVGGFLEDLLTKSLPGQVEAAGKEFGHFRDLVVLTNSALTDLTGFQFNKFPTVTQARKEVQGLLDELNRQQDLPALNQVIVRIKEIQKEMAGGTEEEKAFSKGLDSVVKQFQGLAKQPAISFPVQLPREFVSGQAGSDAGKAIIDNLRHELSGADLFGVSGDFFTNLSRAMDTGGARFVHSGELTVDEFTKQVQLGLSQGFLRIVATVNQGAQALADAFNRALIAGAGPEQLRSILEKQLAEQNKIIAAADKRIAQSKPGSAARKKAVKIRSAALDRAAAITGQIKSQTDEIKSDADKRAKEIKDAQDKADQSLLDALEVGRTPFERRLSRAEATPGERDNIAALLALRKRLQTEIDQVKKGVKDGKTKTAELRRLNDQLFQNSLDITAARKRRNDALAQALQDRGVAIQSLGETTGNFRLVLKGLDLQIAAARKTLDKAKQAKTGIEAANAALEALKKTRRDSINAARSGLLEQAFSLAEARGNKSTMLQIIDLQIKQAKREEQQAKTLLDRLVAQTKIQELINKRREILADEAKKGQEGTTAFDLLKQFSDQFNQTAGSLIGANQPFAGPTGFTADIAQFLRRRKGPGGLAGPGVTPGEPGAPLGGIDRLARTRVTKEQQQTDLTTALIAALKELTDATLKASGNTSTASGTSPTFGAGARSSWGRWNEARQARLAEEA